MACFDRIVARPLHRPLNLLHMDLPVRSGSLFNQLVAGLRPRFIGMLSAQGRSLPEYLQREVASNDTAPVVSEASRRASEAESGVTSCGNSWSRSTRDGDDAVHRGTPLCCSNICDTQDALTC